MMRLIKDELIINEVFDDIRNILKGNDKVAFDNLANQLHAQVVTQLNRREAEMSDLRACFIQALILNILLNKNWDIYQSFKTGL